MRVVFADEHGNTLAEADCSAIPRAEETVMVHLTSHFLNTANQFTRAVFRVVRVNWEACNIADLEPWMRPYANADGCVTLTVSALDDPTRAYMQRMHDLNANEETPPCQR